MPIQFVEREPEFPSDYWGEIVSVDIRRSGRYDVMNAECLVKAIQPAYKNLQRIFLPLTEDYDKTGELNVKTYTGFFFKKLVDAGWEPKGSTVKDLVMSLKGLKARFQRVNIPTLRTRTPKWIVTELGEPKK
jgi:hypothetical protein